MSRPAASPEVSTTVAAGVVVVDVAIAAAGGKGSTPPDWIKIGPRGAFVTRDGRPYSFDPEALAARFNQDSVDIPVDLDHGIVEKRPGADGAAKGWIKEMEARPDGLYGRVDWLEGGKVALAARTHRFISPSFYPDAQGAATWVHSVSLVPAPALPGAAVASAGSHSATPETSMKALAQALGLNDSASEAACLAALTELRAGTVDKKVHDEAIASLNASKTELDGIKAAARKATVDGVLDEALKAKKILPAEKDHYASLCATDAGLESVKQLIAAKPAQLAASGLDGRQAPNGAAADVNPVTLAAQGMARQAELRSKGVEISIAEAIGQISAEGAR